MLTMLGIQGPMLFLQETSGLFSFLSFRWIVEAVASSSSSVAELRKPRLRPPFICRATAATYFYSKPIIMVLLYMPVPRDRRLQEL